MPQLNGSAFSFNSPGQRHQLGDEASRMFRIDLQRIQPLAILAFHLFRPKDASRQQHRRQHFVQIVHDAACQSANGFHTLRTEELRLEQF